ncbi:MAG: low molecular weight protein-tyrosine-phosphatase [Bacteroidia bacterium]|nr:low molecular weight phosphotyrosine protein phosphatase [Bacteroidia bacterium]MDW8158897.1 low molecular weight protein-tyrosine-phosphatase [Bacteroidia bacterium]
MNLDQKVGVLFVCIGNICRSPLAQGIFEHKIQQKGLSKVLSCDSAGIASYHIGSLPHPLSQAVARKRSIELNHRARLIQKKDFERFQYILTMEDMVHAEVMRMQKRYEASVKIQLMRCYDPLANHLTEVPDPYYSDMEMYEEVFQILDRSCEAFLAHLIEQYSW